VRLLLVEDDHMIGESMTDGLACEGFTISSSRPRACPKKFRRS
jgi:hypothetical protein